MGKGFFIEILEIREVKLYGLYINHNRILTVFTTLLMFIGIVIKIKIVFYVDTGNTNKGVFLSSFPQQICNISGIHLSHNIFSVSFYRQFAKE